MPLRAFTVEKYRSFVQPTRVELRPLTLLFGYNGAGKSSLLRTLPLLAASTSPASAGPLALSSEAARGATFVDLHSQFDKSSYVRFGLEWDDDENRIRQVDLSLYDVVERREQVVERIRAFTGAGAPQLEALWAMDAPPAPWPTYSVKVPEAQPCNLGLEFLGIVPKLVGPAELRQPEVESSLREVARRLDSLRTSVHWLGAVRQMPERRANYLGRPRRMQPSGNEAAAILAYDKRGQGDLLHRVSNWYEQATRQKLDVVEEGDSFSLVVSPVRGTPVRINLVDTGEGLGQVLPVLVLALQALRGELGRAPTLAIEHPELHLHPAAERELAAFFCEIAGDPAAPRMLLETHSENFLLRVQLAIVRGELPADRVLVYWVRGLEDGRGVVEPMTFDDLARPEGDRWPPGVFSEDVEQARQIVLERRKRSRK